MKEKKISVTFAGIEIVYDESSDRWEFVQHGHSRWSKSLRLAKESISKGAPKEKTKHPFEPIAGILLDRWGEPTKVTVTSIASSMFGKTRVWASSTGKSKRKERSIYDASSIAYDDAESRKKLASAAALRKQSFALDKKAQRVVDSIKRISVPNHEDGKEAEASED